MIDETDVRTLTDTFVITKRFRSPNEFSIFIDEMVVKYKISYMEAIINYCNEVDIDIEAIGSLVNSKLKEKIQVEAEQANLMKPRGHLPF
jgi:hypothetical protein